MKADGRRSTRDKNEPANAATLVPTAGSADLDIRSLSALRKMRDGDFSVRLPNSWTTEGKVADTFNEIVAANQQMATELKRIGQVVGKEGRTRSGQDGPFMVRGEKSKLPFNTLVEDLFTAYDRSHCAIGAVAQGNLTQTVRLDVDGRPLEGEFPRSANTVNTMIQQLSVFTSEVTRVAREVGTDGKLEVRRRFRRRRDLERLDSSVNSMASNLTGQVRNIAEVATAVASGICHAKLPSMFAAKFCSSKIPLIQWWISFDRSRPK